ncbi:hypothetical protein FS837_000617, partial [Tulasnella sp. UAMH 9824]
SANGYLTSSAAQVEEIHHQPRVLIRIRNPLTTLNPKAPSSLPMDSYFTVTSFAATSASSKPEDVVIVDQEGGSTGGQGYCTIA